jgi:hypothetical protein
MPSSERSPSPSPSPRGSRRRRRSAAADAAAAAEPASPALPDTTRSTKPQGRSAATDDDTAHGLWTLYLCLIICHLVWYRSWNELVDSVLGLERTQIMADDVDSIDYRPLVLLLPLVLLAYHDMRGNPSKRFVHAVPDEVMNYVLRVAGGYGLVQVLAQDLGLRSGLNQRNIVQQPAMQFLMLWGGSYALTGHRSEGMVSALLYFVLKYNVSGNVTANVCFEDV